MIEYYTIDTLGGGAVNYDHETSMKVLAICELWFTIALSREHEPYIEYGFNGDQLVSVKVLDHWYRDTIMIYSVACNSVAACIKDTCYQIVKYLDTI